MFTSLGIWQIQRLSWKTDLIRSMTKAETSTVVEIGADTPAFQRVSATGTFAIGSFRYGAEARDVNGAATMGADLISIVKRPGRASVMVDRGWMPDDASEPEPGPASVEGIAFPPDRPGWLTAPNDLARRRLYMLDPASLGSDIGQPDVLPMTVLVVGPSQNGISPASVPPTPPNNHLEYALTWFGLAGLSLFGVAKSAVRSRNCLPSVWATCLASGRRGRPSSTG